MSEKSPKATEYVRHWTFIVYPDSAPEHWQDVLDKEHIPWACSPLHEADSNPDGEAKKLHWHVVVSFEGKKSFNQVADLIRPLNCTIPIKVASMKGLLRYFVHLDNPEKHQYNLEDIIYHGGFDPQNYLAPSSSQRYHMIKDMVSFIKHNGIVDYLQFMDYCAEYHFDDWFPLLCDSCSFVIDKVINSNFKQLSRRGTSLEAFYKCSCCGEWFPESMMSSFVHRDAFSIDNICSNCGMKE